MNAFKKISLGLLAILALLFFVAVWYSYEFSMDKAVAREINTPNLERKILIATQGSEFKDKITQQITDHYTAQSAYIKVIDITSLRDIDIETFDAIVLIHTWEYNKPPQAITDFIERSKAYRDNIVALSTSGEGSHKLENIDAIAGESILLNSEAISKQIISKVDTMLQGID